MARESAFTSIADVLAAAQKKSREETAKLKPRALSAAELLDDFDYAIEARRSIAHNPAAVEKAAVTILVARRRIATDEAAELVKRAIRYLDG